MKFLSISGGGATGSYAVGELTRANKTYDVVIGTSTGALMAPMIALQDYDTLFEAYTSVSQKDIFTHNPFKKNGKVNLLNVIWKSLKNIFVPQPTLGDTTALRKTIEKFYTPHDHERLRLLGRRALVTACQLNANTPVTKSFCSDEETYERFCDYMWASANAPLFTSILTTDQPITGERPEWIDGGVIELMSMYRAIELGATELDVIILRPKPVMSTGGPTKDLFQYIFRLIDIITRENERDEIQSGLLLAKLQKVNVNLYWLPRRLTKNSLTFNKAEMLGWFKEGLAGGMVKESYNYADVKV